ncbi:MAG TPA: potassium channel family protein [Acidimicrobiia bacterium]
MKGSWGIAFQERYGLVLGLILVGYLLSGSGGSPLSVVFNSMVWATLLLATLWAPGLPAWLRRVGLAATAVALLTVFTSIFFDSDVASGSRHLVLAVAQSSALVAILFRISRHNVVTLQTVMGGVAAFALIAFVMAAVYHGLDLLIEGPFLNGLTSPGDYTYFSFVTLTTVGYGDLTAATDLAKRLVVVEAFVGQVFLITLVARLVSLWAPRIRE